MTSPSDPYAIAGVIVLLIIVAAILFWPGGRNKHK